MGSALETSLVEWKHEIGLMGANGTADLGNFLSGMETLVRDGKLLRNIPALETSLVEWKLFRAPKTGVHHDALETSLVEWKHLG